jgi:hypothetical protein
MTRLRFSVRDLLWLTALCAVLVAWWLDRRRLAAESDRNAKLAAEYHQKEIQRASLAKALRGSKSINDDQQVNQLFDRLQKLNSVRSDGDTKGSPRSP